MRKAFFRFISGVAPTLASLSLLLFSRGASAKISDMTSDWKVELGAGAEIWLLGIAAVGVAIGGSAVISGIIAKKNGRPLEWQLFGFIGGGLATVVPLILLAVAGSLSGDDSSAQSTLSELNLKY